MDKNILEAAVNQAKSIKPEDLRQHYIIKTQKEENERKSQREMTQKEQIEKANRVIKGMNYVCSMESERGATCAIVYREKEYIWDRDDVVTSFDIVFEYCNRSNLNPKVMYLDQERCIVVQW